MKTRDFGKRKLKGQKIRYIGPLTRKKRKKLAHREYVADEIIKNKNITNNCLWNAKTTNIYIALRCVVLHSLHCVVLRCAALRCAALHCTALHCTFDDKDIGKFIGQCKRVLLT